MKKRIYLSPPHISERERALLHDAVESNWIAPLGPHVDAFEKEICEYVGVGYGCALSSGTAALHMALRLVGVGAGDTVFCSSFTFVASVNPAVYLGAKPVFIDSEPRTGNMCPDALARAFADAERTGRLPKAVITVDLYGQSCDYDRIGPLCEKYGVPIVEDAAEALGASYSGKKCGSFGKIAALSFNGNKILTTSGGGMIVSDDKALIQQAHFLSQQAKDPAPHYEHTQLGFNYRLSNLLAAVGRGQLAWLDERIARRKQLFARYKQALGSRSGITFFADPEIGFGTRWLIVMQVDPAQTSVTPAEIMARLESVNAEARPAWKPMHRQPLYADCAYYPHSATRSVSDELFARGLCLPSGSSMTDEEQELVISKIVGLFEEKAASRATPPLSSSL